MRNRAMSSRVAAALAMLTISSLAIVSCGGGTTGLTVVADMEHTSAFAAKQNHAYCNVRSGSVCQSPDGALRIDMPLELYRNPNRSVTDGDIALFNEGYEAITLIQYHLTLLDDSNHLYLPEFEGPQGYRGTGDGVPPLTIMPNEEIHLRFWATLEKPTRTVRSVTVHYRLEGDTDFTVVEVSYRPSGYYQETAK